MTNEYNAEMWLSENRTEIAPMVEHPFSNGKVSGLIPDSVMFLCCWFKNNYAASRKFGIYEKLV